MLKDITRRLMGLEPSPRLQGFEGLLEQCGPVADAPKKPSYVDVVKGVAECPSALTVINFARRVSL